MRCGRVRSCCCVDLIGPTANVFRSLGGGASWAPATSGVAGVNILALVTDPVRANALYAGGTGGVFRSPDGGDTWAPFGTGLESTLVSSIALDSSGSALYAGTLGDGAFRLPLP